MTAPVPAPDRDRETGRRRLPLWVFTLPGLGALIAFLAILGATAWGWLLFVGIYVIGAAVVLRATR